MEKFLTIISIPLVILNAVAGIGSFMWLLLLGEWRVVLYGIIILVVFPIAYGIVTLPLGLLFGGGAYLLDQKMETGISRAAGILHSIVSDIINFGWLVLVFSFAISYSEIQDIPLFLMMLVAYSIGTGGFTYMASKESYNEFTLLSTFMIQLAAASLLLLILFGLNSFGLLVLLILLIVHTVIVAKVLKESQATEPGL